MITDHAVMGEAAEALLDAGISLPLLSLKLPWLRRPLRLGITMRRPTLGAQIRLARHYLRLGHSPEDIEAFSSIERLGFMAQHGVCLSELVALACLRGRYSGALLYRPLAWLIRWRMPQEVQLAAMLSYMHLTSSQPFTPFISYVAATSPLLSHQERGS